MNARDTCAVLNDLVATLSRSLPMYLADAAPWTQDRDATALAELGAIVEDQHGLIDRVGDLTLQRGGAVLPSVFPMEFTATHDLSLEYLLTMLVGYQRQQVDHIERVVAHLDHDPQAQALGKEVLGASKGHLVTLEELVAGRSAEPSPTA